MRRRGAFLLAVSGALASGCGSCGKGGSGGGPDASPVPLGSATVIAEPLPRCRGDAQRAVIPGEDVIVGDVAIGEAGLLVGVVRTDGGKRIGSVMRLPPDLATSAIADIGPSLGDDPPPSPRYNGQAAWVAFLDRQPPTNGVKLRALKLARIFAGGAGKENAPLRVEATVLQQADESTSFDVAWNDAGGGLAAWDEDAPSKDAGAPGQGERGFVKVQLLAEGARARVASPETSDAESPRLLPKAGGGFWLAWLARRVEEEAYAVEGPGEPRAFRWVEVVALDPRGEPTGPVRRVSSEKGRAAAFELGRHGSDLVVMVQDEVAPSEGAGARIVRYLVADKIASSDVVDGGVGHAFAELVPGGVPAEASRWLAWTDVSERTHLTPLGPGLVASGSATYEPTLDGARVLATAPDGTAIYALVGASGAEPAKGSAEARRPEVRRFVCK